MSKDSFLKKQKRNICKSIFLEEYIIELLKHKSFLNFKMLQIVALTTINKVVLCI